MGMNAVLVASEADRFNQVSYFLSKRRNTHTRSLQVPSP